jgi:pSer/pThr/pTyr-binding forkhead associated (FHA) protein
MTAFLTKVLGVVCPSCELLNVVGAVRCMSCGATTDSSTAKTDLSPSLVPQPTPSMNEASEKAQTEEPPGLRRSGPHPAPQAEVPGSSPSSVRGVPARPTFQSSAAPPPQSVGPKFGLTVLGGPARGQRFRIGAAGAQIGRARGVILFPEDPFVSPLHATLAVREGKLTIHDEGSTSGSYISIAGQETVPPGGLFCTGLRLFRYVGAIEPAPPWNRVDVLVYGAPVPNNVVHYAIEEVLLGDRPGRCIITPGPVLTVGQGRCDFSFPNDEGLAPRHCEVAPMPTGAMIRDLSGGLGTFARVAGERVLKAGDRVRIGQQTLQVEVLS